MSDTSSVQESDAEDDNDEEVPVVTLHPKIGYEINTTYECPLASSFEHTFAAAQASAQQGCPRCILRVAAISEIFPNLPASAIIECSHDSIFLPFRIDRQRVVLASHDQHDDEDQLICEFYDDEIGGIGCVERVVPCDTNSAESLETVKEWVQICDNDHDCLLTPESLPRRLLDVRHGCVRLHETIPSDTGSLYACLSHCWGKPSSMTNPVKTTLRTTLATIDTYRESISWEDLPLTFQDAISFTRKLGIPFLWIDSLCIIQDDIDKQDWQEQSAKMASIYRNAYITLAATAAKDAHGGMYTRDGIGQSHCVGAPLVKVQYADGRNRGLFARRKFGHEMDTLPLLRRGWVYQERLLSPRVLHFVGEELIWECNHLVTCECGSDDLDNGIVDRVRIFDDDYVVVGPSVQHPAPLDLWYSIVSDYTTLSLTKESDIFPALSGIAKVFAAKIGDEYVAGLWKSRIVSNLLWFFREYDEDKKPDKERVKVKKTELEAQVWRAPSWSWASSTFDSEIRFLPVTRDLANVKDVKCMPSGVDTTGELESARLTITTKVVPAHFDPSTSTICLSNGFKIHKAPDAYSHSRYNLETGYFGLHTAVPMDIIFTQMATCIGEQKVHLYDIHADLHIEQEVRSYLLLARQADDWVRVGVATISEYEQVRTLFAGRAREERESILQTMTREEIDTILEQQTQRNREVFRWFDDEEMQDLVVL